MSTLKDQEIKTTLNLLQSKSYLDKPDLQEQVVRGLFHFGIFSQMINDPELNRYLNPYLIQFVKAATVTPYKAGKVMNLQGQFYNTLYLILSGKVVFYKNKNTQDIDNEMYFINQEQDQYKKQLQQDKQKFEEIQQQMLQKDNKKNKAQSPNSGLNNKKGQFTFKDAIKKQKPYSQAYQMINGKFSTGNPSQNLKILQNPEDNMLRNSSQCSSQYYQGSLCLYKIYDQKKEGDYFGDIVNSVKGKKSEYTAVIAQDSIILQIGDLTFKGYTKKVLLEIALQSERRDFKQEQGIYSQNTECSGFYILKEGEVAILKDKKKIQFLKKGSIFGHEDLFYKNRKFEAVSDSNKTVIFEIVKKKVQNYYFLQDVKNKGQPALEKLNNLVNCEGDKQNKITGQQQKIIEKPQIQINTTKMNNLTMNQTLNQTSMNKSQILQKTGLNLNSTQANIFNRFMNNRGSISLITPDMLDKSINDKELIMKKLEEQQIQKQILTKNKRSTVILSQRPLTASLNKTQANNTIMKPLNLSRAQQRMQNSQSITSPQNKQSDEIKQMTSNRTAQSINTPKIERFAMIQDQDVFNDEDYSEKHLKEIASIKSINKLRIEGQKRIVVQATQKNQFNSMFNSTYMRSFNRNCSLGDQNQFFQPSPPINSKFFSINTQHDQQQYFSDRQNPRYTGNQKIDQLTLKSNLKNSQLTQQQQNIQNKKIQSYNFHIPEGYKQNLQHNKYSIIEQRSPNAFSAQSIDNFNNFLGQGQSLQSQNQQQSTLKQNNLKNSKINNSKSLITSKNNFDYEYESPIKRQKRQYKKEIDDEYFKDQSESENENQQGSNDENDLDQSYGSQPSNQNQIIRMNDDYANFSRAKLRQMRQDKIQQEKKSKEIKKTKLMKITDL